MNVDSILSLSLKIFILREYGFINKVHGKEHKAVMLGQVE
jgi:hypothetical protein